MNYKDKEKEKTIIFSTIIGILSGLLLTYLILLAGLWLYARKNPDSLSLRDAVWLVPDVFWLIRRLASDRSIGRGARFRLVLLIGYLLLPFDIVPDFIPVIGYADDAIVIALVLRSVIRSAGSGAIVRHWSGSRGGLLTVLRLAGIRTA